MSVVMPEIKQDVHSEVINVDSDKITRDTLSSAEQKIDNKSVQRIRKKK